MSENHPLSRERSFLPETILAELEETRRQFLALLASLSEADFQQKSTSSAWTVKQLLVHIPRDTQRDESKQTIRGATTCS